MVHEKDIFLPDPEIEKQYKNRLNAILENKLFAKNNIIDIGPLPEVYKFLGIRDKELKLNTTTIQKAIGLKGKNNHQVPKVVLENLLALVHNPKGVFRSLSTSKNPNGYVAVLEAKSENQDQIIAILSPSKNGKGFTFIPSVYDKQNFEALLEHTYRENKILYIKDKGSELWGRHQLPPRHNPEPSVYSILTKNDIVKRILEKNPQNLLKNQGMREADGPVKAQKQPDQNSREMEQAKKAGYVQGVCECAALVGNQTIAKKLLTEMKVNKDMAKKYAGPETYKALEQGVFAPKPEHRRELTRSRGRSL